VGSEPASGAFSIKGSALGAAAILGVRRVLGHRCRQPVQRAQSPFAEIAFAAALYGTVRAAAHAWVSATDSFALRDELFQDMAVAHTYKNSIRPWIQSGVIALISSIFVVFATALEPGFQVKDSKVKVWKTPCGYELYKIRL